MDARILFLSSTLFMFGEAGTSGADPTSNVKIFMKMDSPIYGAIVGEAPLPPPFKESAIEVVEMREAMYAPTDAGTGLPTGQRRYEGIVIRKPMDKTTPQIGNALAINDNLTEVELLVFIENRTTRVLELRFQQVLEDVRVVRIERELFGKSSTSTALVPRPEEEITLNFMSFVFRDVVNSIEYQDDTYVVISDVPVTGELAEETEAVAAEQSTGSGDDDSE